MAGCATRLIFYLADVGLLTRRLLTEPRVLNAVNKLATARAPITALFIWVFRSALEGDVARENHEVGPRDIPGRISA